MTCPNSEPAGSLFRRTVARAVSGPYFTQPPPELNGEALASWQHARAGERDELLAAAEAAADFGDLTGRAKEIFDRAGDAVVNEMAQEDLYHRLYGGG